MIERFFKIAAAGLVGGVIAILACCAFLMLAGFPLYESSPRGYRNPSASVGESIETVLVASAVFAVGASAGVLAAAKRTGRRGRTATRSGK